MPYPTPLAGYQSYKGLPQLAGLCTVEEAAKPGLSVEECVRRLKRFHYCFKRLHQILTARITAEPIYELKTGFAHHAYLCAEHVTALRTRIAEMREPPLGLEDVPHPALEAFFDEILAAPTTEELLVGVYEIALVEFDHTLNYYLIDTNFLTDAPSSRVLRFAREEIADMIEFGMQCTKQLLDEAARSTQRPWVGVLHACLKCAGDLVGPADSNEALPPRMHSAKPNVYDPVPRRLGLVVEERLRVDALVPRVGEPLVAPRDGVVDVGLRGVHSRGQCFV